MHAYLNQLLNQVPADSYGMFGAMFVLTFGLVRCSLHPTLFALIAWPGTLAHELAHMLIGLLLGARPASLSLFPKALGGGRWQLGAVAFTNLKWWNAPWTAMAPMLLAPGSLVLALAWAYPVWISGDIAHTAVALYVCSTILQASWPSSTDFQVAFPGLAIIGLVLAWFW